MNWILAAFLAAGVVGQQRDEIGPLRNLGAVGIALGNEVTERAVTRLEVMQRRSLSRLCRDFADTVPVEKQHTPIADCRPVAELQRDGLRVVHELLDLRLHLVLDALDLLIGDRLVGKAVNGFEHDAPGLIQRMLFAQDRGEDDVAGILLLQLLGGDLRGEAGFDECLVQAPGWRVGQDVRRDL